MPQLSAKGANKDQACGSKMTFSDYLSAKRAALAFKKRKGITNFMTVYKCSFCDGFHFGNARFPTRADKLNHRIDRALAKDRKIASQKHES